MNLEQRRQYHRTFAIFIAKQEKYWYPKILKALQVNNQAFADYMVANGVTQALGAIDTLVSIGPIMEVLSRLYLVAGGRRARMVRMDIRRSASQKAAGIGFNESITVNIRKYFELYILNKSAIPITNTQKKAIRQVLEKGIEEGWGVEKMAREITGGLYTRRHARVVVRTETVRASNAAAELAAQQSDFIQDKEWISAMDDRVRRPPKSQYDHWDMDGQIVPFDRPFFSGGEELQFPGDPAGSAGNIINCRCCVGYNVRRDARGNPVKKPEGYTPALFSTFSPQNPAIQVEMPAPSRVTVIQPAASNITQVITIGIQEAFR